MKTFITDHFLLRTETARELYHEYAAPEPIFDYHCHLPPAEVAANKQFRNVYEIWLAGDHYKWRAMRANGIGEEYCTGEASDYDKFLAWARTVPKTLRNPLYHWTHLELLRFFGIEELLDEETAPRIWEEANEKLASPEMSVKGILDRHRVKVICTTDDPVDNLEHHKRLREEGKIPARMYPAFRPDKALVVDQPDVFNEWVQLLEEASGISCTDFAGFLDALRQRHGFFHSMGGRLSDHGLERCSAEPCSEEAAATIYRLARNKQALDVLSVEQFRTFMMLFFGRLDAGQGWTKQLHLGAMRNNNSRKLRELGPDTGFDSIGDWPQARALARYLDLLDETGELPKTILYNLNPADNYVFAAIVGSFQGGGTAGKMQFGSGWWHLDQKEGMTWQLNALSNLGLLSRFVGMLTDSRSFLSYSRHEYFRRILCELIGRDVENGELPRDMKMLGCLVRDISYRNAEGYFGLEV